MNMRSATKAVYDAFATAWGSTTPVLFGNEASGLPNAPWLRVSMRENTSDQLTIGAVGNQVHERRASVYVQIFSPADEGEGPLLDLAQAARDVFEGKSFSVAGEAINFLKVDVDRGEDEPHLISAVVEAQCRYQQRK